LGALTAKTQKATTMRTMPQLIRTVKTLYEKLTHHADKSEQMQITLGKTLEEAKALNKEQCGPPWAAFVKEHFDFGQSRADELIRIADGRTNVTTTRAGNAKRMKSTRAKSASRDAEMEPSKPHRAKKNAPEAEAIAASLYLDQGMTREQAASSAGVGEKVVQLAVAREEGRREVLAAPPIDAATLTMPAQEKLAIALRQQARQQDRDFEQRVLDECRKRLDEMILPHHAKKLADAQAIIAARKGVMSRANFKKILACLHPDRVSDELKSKYTEAFHILSDLEIVLCKESELPTEAAAFPKNYAEMMARKQAVSEKRKAARGHNDIGRPSA
jgi:hypothetical protein